ncbi:hypothetical protein D0466_11515 [Peribacillus glennii]|uniref:Uncharacterized protein n=1 Tax=Peribacillus glennii TaxID=2303991 RepID=A0A372LCL7_9BACI|nr:hypothetical protein D0466_11515 [Peribacillus glennii]
MIVVKKYIFKVHQFIEGPFYRKPADWQAVLKRRSEVRLTGCGLLKAKINGCGALSQCSASSEKNI